MKRILGLLLAIVALLILLSACSSTNQHTLKANSTVTLKNMADGGLLTGDPCGPPCFFGIRPDVTTYADVSQTLTKYADAQACQEFDSEDGSGSRELKCDNSLVITFDPQKKWVTGLTYHPTTAITVQELIAKLGAPDNLDVFLEGDSTIVAKMQLYYPDQKMIVMLDDHDADFYTVRPDDKVQTVSYVGEKPYQKITELAQNWSDYGKYIK